MEWNEARLAGGVLALGVVLVVLDCGETVTVAVINMIVPVDETLFWL